MRKITMLLRRRAVWALMPMAALIFAGPGFAQAQSPASQAGNTPAAASQDAPPQTWNFHLQATEIVQGDNSFSAKYSGPNSLSPKAQTQQTTTIDLFAGIKASHDTEYHVDFLTWQGFGLSKTLGIEAFPNSDAYKVGTPTPYFAFARLFARRTIGLGGKQEDISDGQLSLASKQDVRRVTVTAGRYAVTDIFDTNKYAGDPHSQFMNWAMVGSLAWDYAADSVGYTDGVSLEYNQQDSTLRYGAFLLPKVANSLTGDDEYLMYPGSGAYGPTLKDWSMVTEDEIRYAAKSHPGAIRLQAWLNQANMADLEQATAILRANGPSADISAADAYRYKYGFGLNWEQEVSKNVGVFSRLGWNDGRETAFAYTDANYSASLGASVSGSAWHCPDDSYGLAGVLSGASTANQAFLKAGGLGILAGDGNLNYAPEFVLETYYDHRLYKAVYTSLDYQYVKNPAFNQDRGPVSILGGRFHFEF